MLVTARLPAGTVLNAPRLPLQYSKPRRTIPGEVSLDHWPELQLHTKPPRLIGSSRNSAAIVSLGRTPHFNGTSRQRLVPEAPKSSEIFFPPSAVGSHQTRSLRRRTPRAVSRRIRPCKFFQSCRTHPSKVPLR